MISLIVATIDRVTELDRLFSSLERQSHKDFEVLVVDQNPDDRLAAILDKHPSLAVRHFRSAKGLSRARNVGLPRVQGDIVAFPDDDCWYPEDLLANVNAWFEAHPEFAGLLTILRDSDGKTVGPRWPTAPRSCTKEDIGVYARSPNGFLRRQAIETIGFFNEDLGVGADTRYQSGEEFDYFARPLDLGMKVWYEPSLTVHHPDVHSMERMLRKTYLYSMGAAYVIRLHRLSPAYFARRVTRSVGGAMVNLIRGNPAVAYSYLLRTAGYLRGYFFGARELERKTPKI